MEKKKVLENGLSNSCSKIIPMVTFENIEGSESKNNTLIVIQIYDMVVLCIMSLKFNMQNNFKRLSCT